MKQNYLFRRENIVRDVNDDCVIRTSIDVVQKKYKNSELEKKVEIKRFNSDISY